MNYIVFSPTLLKNVQMSTFCNGVCAMLSLMYIEGIL